MTIARFERVSLSRYQEALEGRPGLNHAALPLPCRATEGSAGYDFVSPVDIVLSPGEAATIPTGIRARMEPGWVLLLFPRSSMGFRHQLRLANTTGVIDSDYYHADNEGHILVRVVNGGDHPMTISRGERFCQGVFLPYGLAEEQDAPDKRRGGFGSTGR